MMETASYPAAKTEQSGSNAEVSRAWSDRDEGTRRKLNDQQEREVTRLYASTETPVSEISKRFGIGESSVYRIAQRYGAALRGRTATAATARSTSRRAPVKSTTDRSTESRGRKAQTAVRKTNAATGRSVPAKATRSPGRVAGIARREFRVSYVAVRTFMAADITDAIRQAEAAGATDITGIERRATDAIDYSPASRGGATRALTRRERIALADQELAEASERMKSELRHEAPGLFDSRGRLRKAVVAERIAERNGGRTWLSSRELMALQQTDYIETAP